MGAPDLKPRVLIGTLERAVTRVAFFAHEAIRSGREQPIWHSVPGMRGGLDSTACKLSVRALVGRMKRQHNVTSWNTLRD